MLSARSPVFRDAAAVSSMSQAFWVPASRSLAACIRKGNKAAQARQGIVNHRKALFTRTLSDRPMPAGRSAKTFDATYHENVYDNSAKIRLLPGRRGRAGS